MEKKIEKIKKKLVASVREAFYFFNNENGTIVQPTGLTERQVEYIESHEEVFREFIDGLVRGSILHGTKAHFDNVDKKMCFIVEVCS